MFWSIVERPTAANEEDTHMGNGIEKYRIEQFETRRSNAKVEEPKIESARKQMASTVLGIASADLHADNIAGPDCDGTGSFIVVP